MIIPQIFPASPRVINWILHYPYTYDYDMLDTTTRGTFVYLKKFPCFGLKPILQIFICIYNAYTDTLK